jgi:hypothetical protein
MHLRAASLALTTALALVPVAADATTAVKTPKPGTWSGRPGKVIMSISGKSIDLVAFSFACGNASGRTTLNGIVLKKTAKGYKFAVKAHGNVSYSDGQPDENGSVELAGRFSRTGKSAGGTWRVKTARCGRTKTTKWRAHP